MLPRRCAGRFHVQKFALRVTFRTCLSSVGHCSGAGEISGRRGPLPQGVACADSSPIAASDQPGRTKAEPRCRRWRQPADSVSAEHQGAGLAPDGVGDDEPALVTAGFRIVVSVLEFLQLSSVAVPEVGSARLDMDVVHVSRAIGEAGNGVEQRGTDDVADL